MRKTKASWYLFKKRFIEFMVKNPIITMFSCMVVTIAVDFIAR